MCGHITFQIFLWLLYRTLLKEVIPDKERALQFCHENKLLPTEMQCPECLAPMKLTKCDTFSSDGYKWRCRRSDHIKDVSIRRGSWFSNSNMTIEEILEFTYWWSSGNILFLMVYSQVLNCMGYNQRGNQYHFSWPLGWEFRFKMIVLA